MKQFIAFFVFLFPLLAVGQVNGTVQNKSGVPVSGAKVYWLGTVQVVVSDENGKFGIQPNTQTDMLIVSNYNYQSDTIRVKNPNQHLTVILPDIVELKEVSVVKKNLGVVKGRTSVFNTEKITASELCKAACCNLSESFETNPSVDVSYSDAATGAKQIKMLGLSGIYVQMLTENIPGFRGLASAYGLGFIPGPWMESIQVSKGTSSVINGYEAITGQINVEYKKPQLSEKAAVNLFAGSNGRLESNVNASAILSKHLSTGLLLHASDELMDMDENNDHFMDIPKVRQYNFINRWYYKRNNYVSQLFLRALSEKRTGGQINGNYHIDVDTKRYEFFTKNGYVFNAEKGTSVGFIVSGSLHEQNAMYGLKKYDGHQGNVYANLIYQTSFSDAHKLSTGVSFNYDRYDESSAVIGYDSLRNEVVPGAFAEYTLNIKDKLILLAGLRVDHHSLFGAFLTPRMNLKYNFSDHLKLRASAGKGYRSPSILSENNYLLASSRKFIVDPSLKMEEAWNYGISLQSFIPVGEKELNVSAEWYRTDFKHQAVADVDSDPHEVHFSNLNGQSFANSYQLEANMEIVRGFTATVAHRIIDTKYSVNGILRDKPLINKSKSLITFSYQTPLKIWQFDFTSQFNGGGRMPDPDKTTPLWNKTFNGYTVLNAQITKYFRTWSLYAGCENITGFIQKNPIIDVDHPDSHLFDASMIWGPMHGRKFYIGFRWSLDREN